jgi:hypothetical protein
MQHYCAALTRLRRGVSGYIAGGAIAFMAGLMGEFTERSRSRSS